MNTRLMHRGERGFTLIELLVAIALAGLITGGITAAVMQVLNINHRASNHMICVRQVQQAGKEVSKDALQAQSVNATGIQGFPLILVWTDWEGVVNSVTYDITEDGDLERTYNATEVRVIAQYIDPEATSCCCDCDADGYCDDNCNCNNRVLIFTVTAAVGTESETRVYEVEPRPG